MSQVIPFLGEQQFFLTGVTGFVGKLVLLKLLRCCPNLQRVFVLIRGRKGVAAADRFKKEILDDSPLFDDLAVDDPHFMDKVHILDGDLCADGLGLSDSDRELITDNVSVIFHLAANTNFNEALSFAFEINVFGSMKVMDLARECKNLVSYVHCSTAYVNANRTFYQEINEKVYPIGDIDPYEIIDRVMMMDPDVLQRETKSIIGDHPNTYTFSKWIAENIIVNERGDLPLCIIRPAIIASAMTDPYPGWVDTFIGSSGLTLATGLGAIHVMRGKSYAISDLIPVDFTTNLIILAAWRTALEPPVGKKIKIYHSATSDTNPHTWGNHRLMINSYFQRNRPKKSLSYPYAMIVHNPILFYILHVMMHSLPAVYGDARRVSKGKKPKLKQASKRIFNTIKGLEFFTSNSWIFSTKNTRSICNSLNEVDSEIFNIDTTTINWELYIIMFCQGLKKYLLKEVPDKSALANKL
eukprot:TRINITY_DN10656_c0_g1_i1.p1 TRINITY_DN10656_c0_g1~~TRINITY_DN10656_c0_g1_i1.p1  ORF type:complete len:468 (+),score=93.39 TRINITY_DN10656_c0_g1_i1:18-1421(+)